MPVLQISKPVLCQTMQDEVSELGEWTVKGILVAKSTQFGSSSSSQSRIATVPSTSAEPHSFLIRLDDQLLHWLIQEDYGYPSVYKALAKACPDMVRMKVLPLRLPDDLHNLLTPCLSQTVNGVSYPTAFVEAPCSLIPLLATPSPSLVPSCLVVESPSGSACTVVCSASVSAKCASTTADRNSFDFFSRPCTATIFFTQLSLDVGHSFQ